ncbi:MAG: AI-2E family transporter, partial [Polyangiaceae bacterium]|nr:AI-2E family transporter [Polyangiaceae bacterium]
MALPSSSPAAAQRRRHQRVALAVLLVLTFVVVAWMTAPLLVGLALGAVMGFTAQPLHHRLYHRLGERRALASGLMTLAGGLFIVGCAVAIGWIVVGEMGAAIPAIDHRLSAGNGRFFFGPWGERALAAVHLTPEVVVRHIRDQLGRFDAFAAQLAAVIVQASTGFLLTIVISMWTMYYVLQDWGHIEGHLVRLLPLDPRHTRALVDEFRDVGRRAFVGTLVGAAVQGVTAGIGFAITGVPQPIVWGAVMVVTSFIPVI